MRRFDHAGRLDAVEIDDRLIDMHWTGEIYTGRTHEWSEDGSIDPMEHVVELDGLGRAVHLRNEFADGSDPLFEQDLVRDVLGRVRSARTSWATDTRAPWRGYLYDAEGRLTTVYEHEGLAEQLVPNLTPHRANNAEVIDFADNTPTTDPIIAVDWMREEDVGAVTEIVERDSGISRWHSTSDRNAGHQLDEIEIDGGTTYPIAHDEVGRVTLGAGVRFDYGPRGRLVQSTRGSLDERYLYDAAGRLARVVNGKQENFVWDGDQLIASMAQDTALWQTVWGAGVDQLLEYENIELSSLTGRFVPIIDHRNAITGWWNADTANLDIVLEYTPHGRIRGLAPDGTELCVEEGTGDDCIVNLGLPAFGVASAYRSRHTGITYMRNRWYDVRLGQFLTHDPLGYIDSYNPFAHAGFDPINFWDPFGLGALSLSDFFELRPGQPKDELPENAEVPPSSQRVLDDLRDLQCQHSSQPVCRNPDRESRRERNGGSETSGAITTLKDVVELDDEQRKEGLQADGVPDARTKSPSAPELLRILKRDNQLTPPDLWAKFHTHPSEKGPSASDLRSAIAAEMISVVVTPKNVFLIVPTEEAQDFAARTDVGEFYDRMMANDSRVVVGGDISTHTIDQAARRAGAVGAAIYQYNEGVFERIDH